MFPRLIFLGIKLDEGLTWKTHIDLIKTIISKQLVCSIY